MIMADGRTQMDEPSSQKDAPSSQTDFDVRRKTTTSGRDSEEAESAKDASLGDKPQEDLTAEDLKGDSRGKVD
jgi:hypothetical protein